MKDEAGADGAAEDAAVIVALGANLPGSALAPGGDVAAGLEAALRALPSEGLVVRARSGWWRSAAWPDPAAPAYLNGVALVETTAGPAEVLVAMKRIEARAGRAAAARNAPRVLDLDLVAHGRTVLEGPLVLPHPRAHQRLFVMGPLAEVAPGWRHPVLQLTAADLARTASIGTDARPARSSPAIVP